MSSHNTFLIIPSYIADHKDIDSATALLFGRLNALSNREGYCFASDEYLAECSKCKSRVITDRLKVLKDLGYIKVFTKKNGVIWDRKIYTCNNYSVIPDDEQDDFEKILTKGTETPIKEISTKRINMPLEAHARAPYKNKKDKDKKEEREATASPPIFFSSGQIKMTIEDYVKLRDENLDLNINALIDQASDWLLAEGQTKKDYAAFMRNWIKKHREFAKSSPQKKNDSNQEFAQKVKRLYPSRVDVSLSYIEFIHPTHPHFIHFNENGFQEQVKNYMRKINLNVGEL